MKNHSEWQPIADLQAWSTRVDEVRQRRSDGRNAGGLLDTALEELAVAEEEMRVQQQELLQAHDIITRERDHYQSLFQHAPVAYVVTDAHGLVRQANAAASELLRVGTAHLRGKPMLAYVEPESRGALRRALREIAQSDDSATIELTLAPRRSEPRVVTATIGAARDRTGVQLRWLIVDQTPGRARARDAAALAAAEEADRAKTELLTTVSHELRTPLASIGGYTEILLMGLHGALDERQAMDIERIRGAQTHAAQLLDDLLVYFRVKRGHLEVDMTDVPIGEAAAAVEEIVRPLAEAKGITLAFRITEPGLRARADASRVRQIVLNLLTNAIKFTRNGGTVTVESRRSGHDVLIEVQDTGIGIPADRVEDLFKPFVRLTGSEHSAGVGLGLAISRELANAMRGELTVESGLGEGSTFTLRLPLAR